jgi:hypothetical protein
MQIHNLQHRKIDGRHLEEILAALRGEKFQPSAPELHIEVVEQQIEEVISRTLPVKKEPGQIRVELLDSGFDLVHAERILNAVSQRPGMFVDEAIGPAYAMTTQQFESLGYTEKGRLNNIVRLELLRLVDDGLLYRGSTKKGAKITYEGREFLEFMRDNPDLDSQLPAQKDTLKMGQYELPQKLPVWNGTFSKIRWIAFRDTDSSYARHQMNVGYEPVDGLFFSIALSPLRAAFGFHTQQVLDVATLLKDYGDPPLEVRRPSLSFIHRGNEFLLDFELSPNTYNWQLAGGTGTFVGGLARRARGIAIEGFSFASRKGGSATLRNPTLKIEMSKAVMTYSDREQWVREYELLDAVAKEKFGILAGLLRQNMTSS